MWLGLGGGSIFVLGFRQWHFLLCSIVMRSFIARCFLYYLFWCAAIAYTEIAYTCSLHNRLPAKAGRFWSCPHSRHRHGTTLHLTEFSRSGHKHVKNLVQGEAQTHDLNEWGADALPAEPRLLLILLVIIAECDRYAAMRLTANYNVALSDSTLGAQAG